MFAPASWLSSLNRAYRALLEREEGKEDGDRHVVVELRAAAELLAVGNGEAVAIRVAGCATFAVVKIGATPQGDTLRSAPLRMSPS